MAIINLTDVKSTINDVKRNLFLEDDLTLKFINVSTVLLEVSEGWYLDKNPQRELSSPEFYQISVVAEGLDKIIPKTISVKVGQVEYSVFEYSRPRDVTQEWLLKVQTAQMMKRDV